MRVNLSVAIVAMTELRDVVQPDGTTIKQAIFAWSTKERGFALAAFFYGYITTQFIGGYVSNRFGGRLVSPQSMACLLSRFININALNCLIMMITKAYR